MTRDQLLYLQRVVDNLRTVMDGYQIEIRARKGLVKSGFCQGVIFMDALNDADAACDLLDELCAAEAAEETHAQEA